MQLKIAAAFMLVLVVAGAVQAAIPSWIEEFTMIRAPQTRVVRDPARSNKYYLCWEEGTSRYGVWFLRADLDTMLRMIPRGRSVSLAEVLPVIAGTWTAADQKMCWGTPAR